MLQSGYMMSVGYDIYLQLLEDAVLEEKGEKKKPTECSADLAVSANIPSTYVPPFPSPLSMARSRSSTMAREVSSTFSLGWRVRVREGISPALT